MSAAGISRILTDADLIQAYRAGDARAFDTLVERHFGAVFAIAMARMGDRDVAEDLAQEVFLRSWLFLERLDAPARYGAWVCRITRNLALDWLRRGQRASRLLPMANLDDHAYHAADERTPPPDEQVARAEEDEALAAALSRLPAEERELVLMHYMERLTQAEIAERLGMHRTTVCRLLQRSLKSLRVWLEPALRAQAPRFGSRPRAAARTCALIAAASALSATSKSAMAAVAGETIQTAATASLTQAAGGAAGAGIAALFQSFLGLFITGGQTVSAGKMIAAAIAAVAVIGGGTVVYKTRPQKAAPLPPPMPASLGVSQPQDNSTIQIGLCAPVGTRLVSRMESNGSNVIQFDPAPPGLPNPAIQNMGMTMEMATTVLEYHDGAKPVTEMTFLRWAQNLDMGGMKFEFDTAQPDPPGAPAQQLQSLAIFRQIIGKPIRMIHNERGVVEEVEGMELFTNAMAGSVDPMVQEMAKQFTNADYMKNSTGGMILPMPPGGAPVKIGDTWDFTIHMGVPVMGSIEIVQTYRFTGWETVAGRRLAVIESTGTMSSQGAETTGMPGLSFTRMEGQITAKSYYDPELGVATDSVFNQVFTMFAKMQVPGGKQQEMNMKIQVNQSGEMRVIERGVPGAV